MSFSVALSIFWVIASTIVAFLPMRRQYLPGGILLILAPVVILFLGYQHGWLWSVPALLAFLSMYRNPLRYLWKKWRGHPVERPE
ncbi:DUF2484 family protein [Aestuariivita boseongensis]|uniref:DUF2484 family protein n=1 Tax=Aestuariivita boseongensis TaxID=1470562 RepID=UPI0006832F82|nr:DUF2484 family protein [Aestuariivita boseongensis]